MHSRTAQETLIPVLSLSGAMPDNGKFPMSYIGCIWYAFKIFQW